MIDDQCIENGGIWCYAVDSTNQALLVGMLLCLVLAFALVARIVMRQVRSFGASRTGDAPTSLSARLAEMRAKVESSGEEED